MIGILKILWFNWMDLKNPGAGGSEIYTHQIAKRLVRMGHSVTLFCSKFSSSSPEENIDGVEVIRAGGRLSVYWKAPEFYRNVFRTQDYDVVIDEINTKPFMTYKFVEKGKCVVGLIHQLAREAWYYGTPFPMSSLGHHFLEPWWLKPYAKLPMITVSNSTRNDLVAMGFNHVSVVHNGVNPIPSGRRQMKEDKPTIIFVGRIGRTKKPADVLKAFKMVKRRIPETQLWLVGDGPLLSKLKKSFPEAVFFGHLNGARKDELVARAWVIAVPGVREGWGQIVTDANILGTVAVGYRIPGLEEAIKDEETGLLVSPNPEALTAALIRILEDSSLRGKLSEKAMKWASQFDWDGSARLFADILSRCKGNQSAASNEFR